LAFIGEGWLEERFLGKRDCTLVVLAKQLL
jgi:hypothetical protein